MAGVVHTPPLSRGEAALAGQNALSKQGPHIAFRANKLDFSSKHVIQITIHVDK